MMKAGFVGIGIGASRVKVVSVCGDIRSRKVLVKDHRGDPRSALNELLSDIAPETVHNLVVTGREGCAIVDAKRICESEAVEEGLRVLGLRPDLVVSLGGESFVVYPVGPKGNILDYVAGNRCAAGTVEFFRQQLGRMGLTIEQAAGAAQGGKLVPLAKRCSVHCKSDCTHALNKKKCSVSDIVFTLCHNMAEKIAGLILRTSVKKGSIVAIGGATANPVIMKALRELLPDFTITVPDEAACFEAFGAASIARSGNPAVLETWAGVLRDVPRTFGFLPPLSEAAANVTFLPARRGVLKRDAKYILGIDGGSTTTKAVLVDQESQEICAGHYTKTNGDPEAAMKNCFTALKAQIKEATGSDSVRITGVATTGSSGEILSVLADTRWTHNEIIAHAYGASRYCPDVDTIFEIGGQDSKFSSIRQMVTVDFNMNESCSAGTGSFIEETARDDLGVGLEQISELALSAVKPLRFSNQCAAFANSDTRKAFQEGASREDNLAGLIYAIVENYLTKVVGHRKIGDHVLFQGGTSKNKAIACAFAAKTGKRIIVPPDSELMGCYGIALWLREKLATQEAEEGVYDLDAMLAAGISRTQEFNCKACENVCTVQNLTVNGKVYPFGGRCSRWENVRKQKKSSAADLDLVALRNRMLFEDFGAPAAAAGRPRIGMPAVFSTYSLYPLYSWFFHELGYTIELSSKVEQAGVHKCQTARCYPYEIAHGTFQALLDKGVRTIFVPHVVSMQKDAGERLSVSCPMAQGAPYYLAAAFEGATIHGPVLDFSNGIESTAQVFTDLAVAMGHSRAEAVRAFEKGCAMQAAFRSAVKAEGAQVLARIRAEGKPAIVIVGRPYNAYSKLANMGVPQKFASLGVTVIPCEFLPYEEQEQDDTMYWKYGQVILKSMRYLAGNPQLFPVYISNFGCGPDSFIQHFAAKILGRKPCLFLEFDSHTADAGVATRVAAYLDIVAGYNRTCPAATVSRAADFVPAEVVLNDGNAAVRTSAGELVPINDPRVTLVFPSMGKLNTEALAASCRRLGVNALAMSPADERVLAIGREFTSGKECVPALLTIGSLMDYWRGTFKRARKDEILLFFMPTADGPCRFGQYNVYIRMLVSRMKMADVAIFTLSDRDGYAGLGGSFAMTAWISVVVSGLMDDIKAALMVAAEDRVAALKVFDAEWQKIIAAIATGHRATVKALNAAARTLAAVRLKSSPAALPKVLLAGEIFVRCDELSCQNIRERYADAGIILKRSDATEWLYYADWSILQRLSGRSGGFLSKRAFLANALRMLKGNRTGRDFVQARIKLAIERLIERTARHILGRSGLLTTKAHDIDHVMEAGRRFVNPALEGEAVLSAGSACQVMEHSPEENYTGVVFIGPFNCMPNGVAEALIKPYARNRGIPYLTFDTDAGPMPSNTANQMEVHMLMAKRYRKDDQDGGLKDSQGEITAEPVLDPETCVPAV